MIMKLIVIGFNHDTSQGLIDKKAQEQKWLKNWTILKNLKKKKNQISALFSTQTPPDDWPDAVDRLTIGLVANEYTKLGKTSENLILI